MCESVSSHPSLSICSPSHSSISLLSMESERLQFSLSLPSSFFFFLLPHRSHSCLPLSLYCLPSPPVCVYVPKPSRLLSHLASPFTNLPLSLSILDLQWLDCELFLIMSHHHLPPLTKRLPLSLPPPLFFNQTSHSLSFGLSLSIMHFLLPQPPFFPLWCHCAKGERGSTIFLLACWPLGGLETRETS